MSSIAPVTVVGGGLAGTEAAWQLAERGVPVLLLEMKPGCRSPAHASFHLAELVCSNSFRGAGLISAVGLLKAELKQLGSLLIRVAEETAVPAGRALAVDRRRFSEAVEAAVFAHPRISVRERKAEAIPPGPVVLATGPLTDGGVASDLGGFGDMLSYHDAIAPLVSAEGIDRDIVFAASRYEDPTEEAAYLNCPMNEAEYHRFVEALVTAEKTPLRAFEEAPFFEGCLPVEELAVRGPLTLAYGPLKPVGLTDPRTGKRPFAVVQLRKEDIAGTAFNLVGFQTRLTRPEQRRVFRLIPGLAQVAFERYGQVHRNSFLNAPEVLDSRLRLKARPEVTVAGQLSGVEGYVEAIASGFAAGLFTAAARFGAEPPPFPTTTAIGGLLRYLTVRRPSFQPSNVVWAMIDTPPKRRGSKHQKREAAAKKALAELSIWRAANRHLFP